MKRSFYLFLIPLFAISCSSDVEMNAPYKKMTIVYGLLNADENADGITNELDTQWIKINKTFLGVGDNTVFAGIRDSSEYHDEEFTKKVVQQIHDGHVVQEFELYSKEVSNKNVGGVFYAPAQTVYYFTPPAGGLNQSDDYNILLQFTDGREVSGSTNLVNMSSFNWQYPQAGQSFVMANLFGGTTAVNYQEKVFFRWYPVPNAVIYDVTLRFYFTEIVYDNPSWQGEPISVSDKYLDFYIGTTDETRRTPNGMQEVFFNGQSFYRFVESSLQKNPNIRRQIGKFTNGLTRCFEIRMGIGNGILDDYINVNRPSTGVVQERPIYTNISNGLGLFASRGTEILSNLSLITPNNNGVPQTGNLQAFFQPGIVDLNFCDPNPQSSYYCEN